MQDNRIPIDKIVSKTASLSDLRKLLNDDKKYETFISCFITERDDINNDFSFGNKLENLDFDGDGFYSDAEIEALREATDKNLSLSEIKTFLKKFIEAPTSGEVWDKVYVDGFKEFSDKYPDIPKNVLERFYSTYDYDIDSFSFSESNGQYRLEIKFLNSDSKFLEEYDSNWECRLSTGGRIWINDLEAEEYFYYDPKDLSDDYGDFRNYATRFLFKTGVIWHVDHRTKENYYQVGNSKMTYKFNADYKEIPQELSLGEFKFDIICDENGKVSEIKNNFDEDTKTQLPDFNRIDLDKLIIDEKAKNRIIELLNADKKFGIDFTIDNEFGKMAVKPIIINKTENSLVVVPQNVADDYFELLDNKVRMGVDFDLEYTDKGFKFEMLSQTGAEGADFKRVEYSKNGHRKTTTLYDGNEVIITVEQNGKVSESRQSRADLLLEALLQSDFEHIDKILGLRGVGLGNEFNYNEVYKKYNALTGKNAMEEAIKYADSHKTSFDPAKLIFGGSNMIIEDSYQNPQKYRKELIKQFNKGVEQGEIIKNYDIQDPKIKACLFETARTSLLEKGFIEKINGKEYAVKAESDCIKILQGDVEYSINLENSPSIVKNILMRQNAMVLKHLAQKGTTFDWYDKNRYNTELGSVSAAAYSPNDNKIILRGDNVDDSTIAAAIAHEAAHSFHNETEYMVNDDFKTTMEEEFAVWKDSGEQYDNNSYCVRNYDEMFAECYALIMTGKCNSAYTIATYFPKTLAIVRQMIDNYEK